MSTLPEPSTQALSMTSMRCSTLLTSVALASLTNKWRSSRIRGAYARAQKKITGTELNYPSIVAQASAGNITVNRVLTSVDNSHGKYTVEVNVPNGVVVEVSPSVLEFGGLNDKKIFNVKMSWDAHHKMKHLEGSLKWVSNSKTRVVRSPVVIFE
ncbi:unnamed protein product [Urochloa humidicola]